MFRKLRNLFGPATPEEQPLRELKKSLDLPPEALPIGDLFPLFTPAGFYELGNWPGPFEILTVPGLALTWATELPNQMMLYLTHSTAALWEKQGIDWKDVAMQNLAKRSEPMLATGQFCRDGGDHFALVFMHDDGYGPSRLLFRERLEKLFPRGYLVALPEMSCGLAIAADATESEMRKMEEVVAKCHNDGTRPLVPGIHYPAQLVERLPS